LIPSKPKAGNTAHVSHLLVSIPALRRPQELLMRGPCSAPLLRHVGASLAERPALLGELAGLVGGAQS
jgi:hypothetical protein